MNISKKYLHSCVGDRMQDWNHLTLSCRNHFWVTNLRTYRGQYGGSSPQLSSAWGTEISRSKDPTDAPRTLDIGS